MTPGRLDINGCKLWLLVVALSFGLACVCSSPAVAALERTEMLRSLTTARPADLASRAADMTKRYPEEIRALSIDLIFYRWVNQQYELDPEIDRLDQVAAALAAVSADPAVVWAASVLGSRDWTTKPAPSDQDDRVKLLGDARQSLRAAVTYSTTSPTRSIENLSNCATALRGLDLDLSVAAVMERLAERQLYATRRYRDAEANYERAASKFFAYGLRARVGRIYDDLGHLNSEVGRYADAADSYRYSAGEWEALGIGDLAGKQYINAGLSLAASGKPDSAFRTMLYGLERSRANAHAKKVYTTHAQLLLQAASFCSSRANYADAQKLLDEAENVAGSAGDSLLLAAIFREQAATWKTVGQEPRARGYLTKREAVLSRLAQKGQEAAAKLTDLSIPASEQSALLTAAENGAAAASALGKYQQGVDILKQIASVFDVMRREDDQIRALRSLASQYDTLGDRQRALSTRMQAAQISMRIGKRQLAVDILRDIEESALEASDAGTAVEALREAVQVIEASGDMLALADVLESRGALLATIGQTTDAIRDLNRSAAIYAAEVGEPWSAARVLAKLAEVQGSAGQSMDAVASLSAAVKRVEDWAAAEGVDPSAEPSHADTIFNLYLQLVGLQIREDWRAEALEQLRAARQYMWFGRLRSLLVASGDPAAADVLKELDKTAGETGTPQPRPVGGVAKTASGWSAVLSQVPQFSRFARPSRYSGPVGPIDAMEICRVSGRIPKDMAVLEYAVADAAVYVLIATNRSVGCWELPVGSGKIDANVQSLRTALRELEKKVAAGVPVAPVTSWSDPSLLPILEPLLALQEMLFDPIRKELPPNTTLAIALPAELSGVPFHALPKEKPGSIRFLAQDYAVSYIRPGMLSDLEKPNTKPIVAKTEPVAIFADSGGALPGAVREANVIRAYYPKSQVYSGLGATADRLVRAASVSSIVHIAAHHQPDPNPAKFTLVLSGKPGGQGTVRLEDIMRIKNPNLRLVVLSACETVGTSDIEAAGSAYTAELFALAGFPSVIGGLWKISDTASVELMRNFYRYLALTGKKAEALRRAQVSMIESKDKQFAHPFYWATFALYGDPR